MLNATILLVREKINDIIAIETMIKELGYKAIAVSAVEDPYLFQNPEKEFDLILCHYSQKALFTRPKANGKELPFILISDADEKILPASLPSQKIAYLNQPFSNSILKTLIEILVVGEE